MAQGAAYIVRTAGGLAQLGERDNGIVEATGSSPVSSTIFTSLGASEAPFGPPPTEGPLTSVSKMLARYQL